MPSWSWSLLGALLLLTLGLANLVIAATEVGQERWWVPAFMGLLVVVLGLRWLRDLRRRDATSTQR